MIFIFSQAEYKKTEELIFKLNFLCGHNIQKNNWGKSK